MALTMSMSDKALSGRRIAFSYGENIFIEDMFDNHFKRMKRLKIIP